MRDQARHTGQLTNWLLSKGMDAVIELMDGKLENVLDIAQSIRSRGREAGTPLMAEVNVRFAYFRARFYLDKFLEDLEGGPFSDVQGAMPQDELLVMAHLGRKDRVSQILEQWVVNRPGFGTTEDEIGWDAKLLEAAVLTGHCQAAELILNRLAGTGVFISSIIHPTCVPRHMGGAAALLGRYDEAREHYQKAIRICTEMRFRPELALTRLQLAELLLEQYPEERSDAIAHLGFAIAEFQEMKMQPSLERALR